MNSHTGLQPPAWAKDKSAGQRPFVIDVFSTESNLIQAARNCMHQFESSIRDEYCPEDAHRQEFHVDLDATRAWQLFQQLLMVANKLGFDVNVLPADADKIKLLVCDMDSTIVQSETLDDLAARAGLDDKVKQITERAMRGELDFREALHQRVALLRDRDALLLEDVAAEVKITAGADFLIRQARANGIRTVLVSGGFEPVVCHVAARLGFDRYICNKMVVTDGRLSGQVETPIVDGAAKLTVLLKECEALGIQASATCSIGDGANDLPMLQAAGLGISYYGKPLLRAAIPYQINYTDLNSIVPLLGIRERQPR